ncbi:hybrid sensor histidine kinase/response regulator [Ketobacter sp.]|uniref:hybrid sensor histidine kinase/response regulator n=1 Tax=Ketobacter sp. TaxID=2083498 RepID=UPI0025BCF66F|nr:hybrid sensor histidine kinase/response regulator [Ketobacter sp.]
MAQAQDQAVESTPMRTLTVSPEQGRYVIPRVVDYYQGSASPQSTDDPAQLLEALRGLPWRPNGRDTLVPAQHLQDVWVRLHLQSGARFVPELILVMSYPFVYRLDMFVYRDGQLVQQAATGTSIPYAELELQGYAPVVPLRMQANDDLEIYFRHQSNTVSILDMKLFSRAAFEDWSDTYFLAQGFYAGCASLMFLMSMFLFLTLRDRLFLYYSLFILSFLALYLFNNGMAHKVLPAALRFEIANLSEAVSCLTCTTSCLFIASFLKMKHYAPVINRMLLSMAAFSFFYAIYCFLFTNEWQLKIMLLVGISSYLLIFYIGIYVWRREHEFANYFLLAMACLCISVLYFVASTLLDIPKPIDSVIVVQFSSLGEFIFLSAALSKHLGAINLQRERAAAESKAKTDFLAKMSHEIRTPMNGVIGVASLLDDHLNNDTARHYNQLIKSSGNSLLTIINDILDFSKLEAGKMVIESIPCSAQRLFGEVRDVFEIAAQQKGLALSLQVAPSAPAYFYSDPIRLKQITTNLVSNAMKFTDTGSVRIRIEGLDGNRLRIQVQDTGVGIALADQKKLFQEFSQADESTTRRFGGTGLGLSICRELAKLMGGEVGVQSEVGQGATFWVVVTVTPCPQEDYERQQGDHGGIESDELEQVATLNILVAEDNKVNQMVVTGMLKKLGVGYHCVDNGAEAVAYYRDHASAIDIIFMDCEMPVMDGYSAARKIQALTAQQRRGRVPICAFTAHVLGGQLDQCRAAGMDHHLSKPVDFQQVRRFLVGFVQQARAS